VDAAKKAPIRLSDYIYIYVTYMYILTPQKTVFSRVLLLYILSGYTASLEKIKNGQPEKKTGDTRIFISEIATGYDWLIKL